MQDIKKLINENKSLKDSLKSKEMVTLGGCFESVTLEPFMIRGVAISEGTWNGMYYPHEMLANLAKGGLKAPIRVEHAKSSEFGKRMIGETKELQYDEILKGVVFNAELWDAEAIRLVKDGTFGFVSISAMADTKFEGGKRIVTGLDLKEISLTTSPACKSCFIQFSKNFIKNTEGINTTEPIGRLEEEGGYIMDSDVLSEQEVEKLGESILDDPKTEELNSVITRVKEAVNRLVEAGTASALDLRRLKALVSKLGSDEEVEKPPTERPPEEKPSEEGPHVLRPLTQLQEAPPENKEGGKGEEIKKEVDKVTEENKETPKEAPKETPKVEKPVEKVAEAPSVTIGISSPVTISPTSTSAGTTSTSTPESPKVPAPAVAPVASVVPVAPEPTVIAPVATEAPVAPVAPVVAPVVATPVTTEAPKEGAPVAPVAPVVPVAPEVEAPKVVAPTVVETPVETPKEEEDLKGLTAGDVILEQARRRKLAKEGV